MNQVRGDVRFLILPANRNCSLEIAMCKPNKHDNDEGLTNSLHAERLSQMERLPLGPELHPQHRNAN